MSILTVCREKQSEYNSKIAKHTIQPRENLALQELNYRICVLETFQAFSKSAPMGMKMDDLSYHYQLVDAYIKFVLSERQFGAKTDADGKKRRETAHQSLEKVVQAGRKQVFQFRPQQARAVQSDGGQVHQRAAAGLDAVQRRIHQLAGGLKKWTTEIF